MAKRIAETNYHSGELSKYIYEVSTYCITHNSANLIKTRWFTSDKLLKTKDKRVVQDNCSIVTFCSLISEL